MLLVFFPLNISSYSYQVLLQHYHQFLLLLILLCQLIKPNFVVLSIGSLKLKFSVGFIILKLSVYSSLVLVKASCIFCSSYKIKLSVIFYLIKLDFNLDSTYGYNNDIHKSKIMKYKPNNLARMNTVNTNINIILNREENHLNLRDSYLEIEFVVSDDAGGVFANDADIRLVNYGMMALFSSIKLETSGGRTIEYIDRCHPNLLMYKL